MKSFILALLAATIGANTVKKAQGSPTAHTGISQIGGTYEYSYEQATLKIKVKTQTDLTAAFAADTDVLSNAAFIPYSAPSSTPDKWYAFMCKITYSNTNTKYTPSFKIYNHQSAMISDASNDLDAVA